MKIIRTCKVCGDKFTAIKVTQFFCRRKCFKKDYYVRTKDKSQDTEQHPVYPTKTCSFCEISSQLDFDPVRAPEKFNAWGCPHCGATNQLVWEYQHETNSFQIISSILVSFQFNTINCSVHPPQFQTFRLPVVRPGLENSTILVMSCEPMDFAETQKRDRKKLSFT